MGACATRAPPNSQEKTGSIQSNPTHDKLRRVRFTSSVLLKNNRYLLVQETRSKQQAKRACRLLLDSVPPTEGGSPLDGGAGRDRTDDPLLAKQVLSQLSYSPASDGGSGWTRTIAPRLIKTVL